MGVGSNKETLPIGAIGAHYRTKYSCFSPIDNPAVCILKARPRKFMIYNFAWGQGPFAHFNEVWNRKVFRRHQ